MHLELGEGGLAHVRCLLYVSYLFVTTVLGLAVDFPIYKRYVLERETKLPK